MKGNVAVIILTHSKPDAFAALRTGETMVFGLGEVKLLGLKKKGREHKNE